MQVDNAYKMVHKPATVTEFIARLMGKRELSMADCAAVDRKLRASKSTYKLTAKHTSREYRLRGLDNVPVGQSMFIEGEGEVCTHRPTAISHAPPRSRRHVGT